MVRSRSGRGLEYARLKRGDIVTVVLPRGYGKPRPAVIVQSDRLADMPSVLVCPLTSDLGQTEPIRVSVDPTPGNGLRKTSQVMVDKMTSVSRDKCRDVIGSLDAGSIQRIDDALVLVIGLAD